MKHKKIKYSIIALVAVASASFLSAQTVTLEINRGNWADMGGNPVEGGTLFGIIVDTDNSGFSVGDWGPSDFLPGTFLNLADGTQTTDGMAFAGVIEAGGFGPFAPAYIGEAAAVPHSSGTGFASTGNQFGIIWFPGVMEGQVPTAGDSYGFYTNSNLTIPGAGDGVDYAQHISADIKTADYTVVPEPSTYAAIFGFGVLLFVFLRRRFKK